jgi:hypothetical protein
MVAISWFIVFLGRCQVFNQNIAVREGLVRLGEKEEDAHSDDIDYEPLALFVVWVVEISSHAVLLWSKKYI